MSLTSEYREKYGPDNFETGTVIIFFKQYAKDGDSYTYVAVKGAGKWYCTDGNQYKWFQLLEEINRDNLGNKSLYELTEVEPIWEDLGQEEG